MQSATLAYALESAYPGSHSGRRLMTAAPTVLVVDDDDAIREALAEVLSDEGYSVVTRRDGAEALSYLKAGHRPKAIILDLWMPQMDGWRLRRELLADPELEKIPVVVLTAASSDAPAPLKVAGVLRKPVALQALLGLLESSL